MSFQTDFINKYSYDVIEATQGTTIFPSVKMAQMCLETGYGKSILAGTNNIFNIKAYGNFTPYWKGASKFFLVTEYINGQVTKVNAPFRVYGSPADSISDHTYFLQINKNYTENGVFTATSPEQQAEALQLSGYATAPNYAATLIDIINEYDLKTLDDQKKK